MRIGVPTSAHGRALPLPLALLAFLTFATTAASASFVPPMLTNPGKGAAKLKMSAGNLKSRATEYQLRQKEKAKLRTARENERRKHRWRGLTAGILLASQGFFACGAIVIALPSRAWRMLPGKMPAFWRVPHDALTTDAAGRLGFMLSNVAYLYAGIQLLLALPHAPHYGVLTLAVCGASCAYHAAQVLHGPESEASARTCSVDTALAIVTGLIFVSSVNIDAINLSLAAISLAFFTDRFSLGYHVVSLSLAPIHRGMRSLVWRFARETADSRAGKQKEFRAPEAVNQQELGVVVRRCKSASECGKKPPSSSRIITNTALEPHISTCDQHVA